MPSPKWVRSAVFVALCSLIALLPNSVFAAGNITLNWDPSPSPNAVSYRIYYGSSSGVYPSNVFAGNATTITISNLADGIYYFAATSSDTNGIESIFSNEATGVVSPANQRPTLDIVSDVSVNEDSGVRTVDLSGISSGSPSEVQTLTVTAISSNPALISNPTINYSSPSTIGSLNFTPTPNVFGSASITVTVNDGANTNNTISRSFTVTVNSVNDSPTLSTISNRSINEDSGTQSVSLAGISSGATNETQTLTVTASSSNPSLIPNPTVAYTSPNATGTLSFTPIAAGFGSATITVTVNDGGATNNTFSRTFTVTVNSANDAPTLNTLANVTIGEDASSQTVNLSGITSGATNESQTLTITATSSNPSLIPNPTVTYTSPNATGSIAFAPAANASGSATITVTVNDGGASNNTVSRSFTATVNSVNDQPTLNSLANITLNESAGLQTVNLFGVTSGASNESQTLTVTATSSNPGLVPNPTVSYTSPNSTGSLTFTPVASAHGVAAITVTVSDGGSSNNTISRSFSVTVNEVNESPTISSIADQTVAVDTSASSIPFTIGDAETAASSLTLSASSSSPSLVPNSNIVLGGSGTSRNVTVIPASGRTGVALITITVSDGTTSDTSSFQLSVINRPAPPGNLRVTAQTP